LCHSPLPICPINQAKTELEQLWGKFAFTEEQKEAIKASLKTILAAGKGTLSAVDENEEGNLQCYEGEEEEQDC
jgi:hypothetical protein